VLFLRVGFRISERRAIRALGYGRASMRYQQRSDPQHLPRSRLREMAANRPSYGYLRLHTLLLREGWKINRKRVYRLYKMECLELRHKKTRKKVSRPRVIMPPAHQPNERWSMDFMSDSLGSGRRIRVFTVVDHMSRVSPCIEADSTFPGKRVVEALNRAIERYGTPKTICVDNGPEFVGRALDLWAHQKGIKLQFSRPGKPTDNAMIETFNAKVRLECLNLNWFESLQEAQKVLEEWRKQYNEERPHRALGEQTPAEHLANWQRQNQSVEAAKEATA
jgi:putative transposase